jgi:putative Ig domain-containing protein
VPTAAISVPGLPSGLGLTNNGDGTATISGTPAAGTDGSHAVTVSAANGQAPDATQSLTVAIAPAPAAPATPVVAQSAPPLVAPKAACMSRRVFTAKSLNLHKGERITRAVLLNGPKTARTFTHTHDSITIKLTGLPKSTFKLRITVERHGKSRTITRTYHTCQP